MTEAEAGLLVPGLVGKDAFNLVVGVPLLLGCLWLARRIDGEQVRRRLAGFVPARALGGIVVGLALLTLAQVASDALAGNAEPLARHVWTAETSR